MNPHSTGFIAGTVISLVVAGCAASGPEPSRSSGPATPSNSATSSGPAGLVAIGHSALTGEGSVLPGVPAKQNSWATGDSPGLGSIAQRLIALHPETRGHVANAAQGGATADMLVDQVGQALADVPTPQLVIVQVIDNDLRCDGTDAAHYSEFHDDVGAALKEISERSPHSKVLLVTQVGRPIRNAQMRMKSGHVTPFGAGECDFFDANGRYVPKKAAHLTDIIVGYEKAQARACKAVPNCWTDNGTGSSFREEWAYFEGADNVHMNTTGLSKLAEHMWPAVEAVLRAPTQ